MEYGIEVYGLDGQRAARFAQTPLLEATRDMPGYPSLIRGLLPGPVAGFGPGCRVRVLVEGALFCEAVVMRAAPQWSDTRKLILDRYVSFHEVYAFEAERAGDDGNAPVARGFANRRCDEMVRAVVNSAPGPLHYRVAHEAYPDGAVREYGKFLARKQPGAELERGGISRGQWVGPGRIDASAAWARDGDTIAGVVVDEVPWPDIRLIMIDAEETERNSHAVKRHPEVAGWTAARYAGSGYAARGVAARQALQDLIDAKGIDYIELNPHQGEGGVYDDRVDAYGRYIALVYGGGECFNAAQVERGHADVYLWQDGRYHDPRLELKDFYSYGGRQADSIEAASEVLASFDVRGGAFEVLTALAYAAGGYVWSIGPDCAVSFRKADRVDRVVFFDPRHTWVGLGSDIREVVNAIHFEGNPFEGGCARTFKQSSSIDAYGWRPASLSYFPLVFENDAGKLARGLLDDVAYPEPAGFVRFYHGDAALSVGSLVEVRDGRLRRLERELPGEWAGRFRGRIVGRVRRVTHRFTGKQVATTAWLTSPFRSVYGPLRYLVRGQGTPQSLYQFRLDEDAVGLDMGFHLD